MVAQLQVRDFSVWIVVRKSSVTATGIQALAWYPTKEEAEQAAASVHPPGDDFTVSKVCHVLEVPAGMLPDISPPT